MAVEKAYAHSHDPVPASELQADIDWAQAGVDEARRELEDAELLLSALQRRLQERGKPETTDDEFAEHVTYLNNMARRCAEETVYRADLCGDDRNTVLRAVIGRLKDAISGK